MKAVNSILPVLCTVIAVVFLASPINAKPKFGLKFGWSSNTLRFGTHEDEESLGSHKKALWEFNPGILMSVELNRAMAFQSELLLLRKGYKSETPAGSGRFISSLTFDYIEIPFLMRITPLPFGVVKPFILLGPAVALLSQAQYEGIYESGSNSHQEEENLDDFFRNTDLSVIFGGGISFHINDHLILLDVRYDLGLTNIYKEGDLSGLRNRSLSFWLDYCL